jgi:hypothetical protein
MILVVLYLKVDGHFYMNQWEPLMKIIWMKAKIVIQILKKKMMKLVTKCQMRIPIQVRKKPLQHRVQV